MPNSPISKKNFLFSNKYPLITNKANQNNTFSVFPIETKIVKTSYNDRDIFKKTVSYDKTSTGAFLGEHNSFSPYNKKDPQNISYSGSNLQEIRHLLKKGGLQSNLIWEIGLRNNLNIRSNYIKNELYDENGNITDSVGGFYDIDDMKEHLPEEYKDENLNEYIVN